MCRKNKSVCAILAGAAVVCLLSACAADGNGADTESQKVTDSAETSSGIVSVQDENVLSEAEERYKAILLGDGEFVNIDIMDHNRKLTLENIGEAVTDDDSIKVEATQFAIVDLDGNGDNEIVLWLQINGVSDYGFEVLYYHDEEVYGFTLTYRQFLELKTDGTFLVSEGAANTSVCKLRLSAGGYEMEEIFGSGSQEEKTNVEWYDLTEDNVEEQL